MACKAERFVVELPWSSGPEIVDAPFEINRPEGGKERRDFLEVEVPHTNDTGSH
jgi:hypothetical protein